MKNERDELARVIFDSNRGNTQIDLQDDRRLKGSQLAWAGYAADAILAAGYRRPCTITTTEELDALPDMSAVLDDMDGPMTRFGSWWRAADGAEFHSLDVVLPATVLYEPEQP